jgi:hypothetical protein
MISLSKYISDFYCSNDQTELVWLLILNKKQFQKLKVFNLNYSFNEDNHEEAYTLENEQKLNNLKGEYCKILKEESEKSNHYSTLKHYELTQIADDIEKVELNIEQSNKSIFDFKENIHWKVLKYDDFGLLVVEIGLPIVHYCDNFWWGHFNEGISEIQDKFYEIIKNKNINPLENISENFKLIKTLLTNDEFIKTKKKAINLENSDSSHNVLLKNREIISSIVKISGSNPEKLRDRLK